MFGGTLSTTNLWTSGNEENTLPPNTTGLEDTRASKILSFSFIHFTSSITPAPEPDPLEVALSLASTFRASSSSLLPTAVSKAFILKPISDSELVTKLRSSSNSLFQSDAVAADVAAPPARPTEVPTLAPLANFLSPSMSLAIASCSLFISEVSSANSPCTCLIPSNSTSVLLFSSVMISMSACATPSSSARLPISSSWSFTSSLNSARPLQTLELGSTDVSLPMLASRDRS
mmetsp:Transcript_8332/g.12122  ORF Transcript_8332/g.12122 Transcript_8332/m.12122 type:complete len:232 (+) Transcript_8332:2905-3600(+)